MTTIANKLAEGIYQFHPKLIPTTVVEKAIISILYLDCTSRILPPEKINQSIKLLRSFDQLKAIDELTTFLILRET